MPTISQVKQRIMALCETIQLPAPLALGNAYAADPTILTDEQLPAFVVSDGRGLDYVLQQRDGPNVSYLSTREMFVKVYLSRMGDETYTLDTDAQAFAEDCIHPLAGFFMAHPTLDLDDAGIVRECRPVGDTSARTLPLRTPGNTDYTKYRGITMRLRVTFIETYSS